MSRVDDDGIYHDFARDGDESRYKQSAAQRNPFTYNVPSSPPMYPSQSTYDCRSGLSSQHTMHTAMSSTPQNSSSRPRDNMTNRSLSSRPQTRDSHDGRILSAASLSPESATAASTVWDELDDLKSRLKRLEAGGGSTRPDLGSFPIATTSASRYRAPVETTAPTVVSTRVNPATSGSATPKSQVVTLTDHPLLEAALARAALMLEPGLYRALKASALDAIALGSTRLPHEAQDSVASAYSIINGDTDAGHKRRLQTESLCRNLTDVCITLCDSRGRSEALQVSSSPIAPRETLSSPYIRLASSMSTSRPRYSMSRLDTGHRPQSTIYEQSEASPMPKDYTARYSTPKSRPQSQLFGERSRYAATPANDATTFRRPLSRAATEIGGPLSRRQTINDSDERSETAHQRSSTLESILANRRRSKHFAEDSTSSDVYAPSIRPQSSVSRRAQPSTARETPLMASKRYSRLGVESLAGDSAVRRSFSLDQRRLGLS